MLTIIWSNVLLNKNAFKCISSVFQVNLRFHIFNHVFLQKQYVHNHINWESILKMKNSLILLQIYLQDVNKLIGPSQFNRISINCEDLY